VINPSENPYDDPAAAKRPVAARHRRDREPAQEAPPDVNEDRGDTDNCLCGHDATQHDRVATRWCEATQAGCLARPCICAR